MTVDGFPLSKNKFHVQEPAITTSSRRIPVLFTVPSRDIVALPVVPAPD
jgi:hypothetical protein